MKLIQTLLSFCSVGIIALMQTVNGQCKLAYVFGAQGTTPSRPNKSGFCSTVANTCCSDDDFKLMHANWEASKTTPVLKIVREKEMKEMVESIMYLGEAKKFYTEVLENIKKSKESPEPICKSSAHVLGNIFQLGLLETSMEQFNKTARKCWDYSKNTLNAFMCASCDADKQNNYDVINKLIFVPNAECRLFTDKCAEHVKVIQALGFYYNMFKKVSMCNEKGHFLSETVAPEFDMYAKTLKATNACLNTKTMDDCAEVCRSQMGFTAMLNFESKFLPDFKKYMADLKGHKELMEKIRKEDPKKKLRATIEEPSVPVAKRVLQGDKSAQILNDFRVIAGTNGVTLSSYVVDNKDGFTDISMVAVFGNSMIRSVGILATLVVLLTL